MVVVAEPAVKGLCGFLACAVDRAGGPAGQHRAGEGFGFAVCLRSASSRAQVLDAEPPAGDSVDDAGVGGAVVGEDAFDSDPVAAEEAKSADEEVGGSERLLVREHFGVGEPAVVVDCDVDELPSDRAVSATVRITATRPVTPWRPAADAFAGTALDSSELLDVDMNQLARAALLVANGWLETEPSESSNAFAMQHRRDGRERH